MSDGLRVGTGADTPAIQLLGPGDYAPVPFDWKDPTEMTAEPPDGAAKNQQGLAHAPQAQASSNETWTLWPPAHHQQAVRQYNRQPETTPRLALPFLTPQETSDRVFRNKVGEKVVDGMAGVGESIRDHVLAAEGLVHRRAQEVLPAVERLAMRTQGEASSAPSHAARKQYKHLPTWNAMADLAAIEGAMSTAVVNTAKEAAPVAAAYGLRAGLSAAGLAPAFMLVPLYQAGQALYDGNVRKFTHKVTDLTLSLAAMGSLAVVISKGAGVKTKQELEAAVETLSGKVSQVEAAVKGAARELAGLKRELAALQRQLTGIKQTRVKNSVELHSGFTARLADPRTPLNELMVIARGFRLAQATLSTLARGGPLLDKLRADCFVLARKTEPFKTHEARNFLGARVFDEKFGSGEFSASERPYAQALLTHIYTTAMNVLATKEKALADLRVKVQSAGDSLDPKSAADERLVVDLIKTRNDVVSWDLLQVWAANQLKVFAGQ